MTPPQSPTPPTLTVKRFLQGWAINTFAVAMAALLLRGIHYERATDLLLASLLLGVLNAFVRPLLMTVALPLLILSLGFFLLVINALLLMLVGQLVRGFHADSFGWAIGGALIIGFVSVTLNLFTGLGRARIKIHSARPNPPSPRNKDDGQGPVIDV
jgi:putative membrane protein